MAQKYPDGDCRRRGPGYVPRTSGGRGHGDNIGARNGGRAYRFAGTAPEGNAPVEQVTVGSGLGLGAMAGMALLASIIGRNPGSKRGL